MTDSLASVQRAALERALLDRDATREYLAFAGALDRVREDRPVERFDAALLALTVQFALDSTSDSVGPGTPTPWGEAAPVLRGARLACRRLDADPVAVATAADIPAERIFERE